MTSTNSVRDRAIDALVASHRPEAGDLLLELANDFSSDLQQAAQGGLHRLEAFSAASFARKG